MGQTTSTPTSAPVSATTSAPGVCPVPHNAPAATSSAPAKCPIDHSAMNAPSASKSAKYPIDHNSAAATPAVSEPAKCPIDHAGLNPLNHMPSLAQERAPGQQMDLPTDRTVSSIPRDGSAKWDYPSPQQFYNALVRKGWETPEEHVETMVEIHNFLNEAAWLEVLKWEKREYQPDDVQLTRFKGRPGEMSPKARFWMFAGWLLPMRFNTEPPFDRHDWIVRRPQTGEEVRYVIDYYSAPNEADGSPAFNLDVRPALDSFASVRQRISVATEETWANFRQNQKPDTTIREPRS